MIAQPRSCEAKVTAARSQLQINVMLLKLSSSDSGTADGLMVAVGKTACLTVGQDTKWYLAKREGVLCLTLHWQI
jgi:hypothetical protein